jgi:anaerobic magnesium-protoporphyrin IX monomethyl ester cyclase
MPLGLLQIASVLKQNGYTVQVLDATAKDMGDSDILDYVTGGTFDYLGISSTTVTINSAYRLIDYIKNNARRKIRIIVGGIHGTVLPDEILTRSKCDVVVMGEGEETIIDLLNSFENGLPLAGVQGIAYRDHAGNVVVNAPRPLIKNIDELPLPAYHLIDLRDYASVISHRKRFITFVRSRGCPFNCIFCSVNAMFKRRYRIQSPARTLRDIVELQGAFRIDEVMFKDSEFLIDRENCKSFFEQMISEKLGVVWSCGARVDTVDFELLTLMKESGCRTISYGIESGSNEVLKRLHKGTTVDQVLETLELTKRAGIRVAAKFMIGNYNETEDELMETYNLIRKIDYDYISATYLTPYPGSELFDKCRAKHVLAPDMYEKLDEVGTLALNLTANVSDETLKKMRKKIYLRSYLRFRTLVILISDFSFWKLLLYMKTFRMLIGDWLRDLMRAG